MTEGISGNRIQEAVSVRRTFRTPRNALPWLIFWSCVAVLLTISAHLIMLPRPFDYHHDWVSAHFSTMARSFAEHGVIALRGVPIQNNPPLGLEPDVYLHWPPLFPIV